MENTSPNQDTSRHDISSLLNMYKQAVKNVPLLRYSWILIATICILAFAAYFKLNNSDVFFYALLVIVISFLGFLFSYLLKTKDSFVRVLLYILLSSLVATLVTAVLAFGTFILWEKPLFYSRWFPNHSENITIDKKKSQNYSKNDDKNLIEAKATNVPNKEKILDSIPTFSSKGTWKPAANIITKNKNLKLAQFELYGLESAYTKSDEFFAAIGPKTYTTYSLDYNYSQESSNLAPNPIFNVVLENTSDKEILITKTLYQVSKVDQVMGGDYGILNPNVKYEHLLEWKTGNQEFPLVPPFRIGPHSNGSFLLQLRTMKKDIGLCWLMKIYFLTSDGEGGISTDEFQLIMTGSQ